MAWKEESLVSLRSELVKLVTEAGWRVTDAAEEFGVSRKTAHKWLTRSRHFGLEGLRDRSRARKQQRRFDAEVLSELVSLRRKHKRWGARHLLMQLRDRDRVAQRRRELPSATTLMKRLHAEGLVQAHRRNRRSPQMASKNGARADAPNDVWTIDFKGHFRLGDGTWCYPLTVRDAYSRKVLCIKALANTQHEAVIRELKKLFMRYGMPRAVHSDTGAPFASRGLSRLSPVNLFLSMHGVGVTFSRPGKPQDNGAHERFHADLKQETAEPPARTMEQQQRRFQRFMKCFNTIRMHQGSGMNWSRPDAKWKPSPRRFKPPLPTQYPSDWEIRALDMDGDIAWRGTKVKLTRSLARRRVALEQVEGDLWRVHFHRQAVGYLRKNEKNRYQVEELDFVT